MDTEQQSTMATEPSQPSPTANISTSPRKSKPKYLSMIKKAIQELSKKDDRRNAVYSTQAIAKHIAENYDVGREHIFLRNLKKALKKAVEDGKLTQVRRSFKLKDKKKKKIKKSKPAKKERKEAITSVSQSSTKKKRSTSRSELKSATKEEMKESTSTKRKQQKASRQKEQRSKKVMSARSKSKVEQKDKEDTAKTSTVAQVTEEVSKQLKYDHMWQFLTRNYGWVNFDVKASNVVEEVYQGYLANRGDTDVRAVKSGEWEYMVDFMAMKQTNLLHPNHTIRDIRRVPWEVKKDSEPLPSPKAPTFSAFSLPIVQNFSLTTPEALFGLPNNSFPTEVTL